MDEDLSIINSNTRNEKIKNFIINNKKSLKQKNDSIFIPKGTIHRIENPFKKTVKILEIQKGSILKETDIVRYQDIYGRVN